MTYITSIIDPQILIPAIGLIGTILVVFAESGLFFGFFLPGDSLLFTAGLFASQGYFSIYTLVIGCMIAAIAGDSVGYWFGKKAGPRIFSKEDSLLFHKKHVLRAQAFYEKYGTKTIFLARFVPIVRTFAPIVAGIGGMNYRTFLTYNISGGIFWVGSMTLSGYFLGTLFPAVTTYLHLIIAGIILLSFVPIAIEFIREKRKHNTQSL